MLGPQFVHFLGPSDRPNFYAGRSLDCIANNPHSASQGATFGRQTRLRFSDVGDVSVLALSADPVDRNARRTVAETATWPHCEGQYR